jgi:hypothetical protein
MRTEQFSHFGCPHTLCTHADRTLFGTATRSVRSSRLLSCSKGVLLLCCLPQDITVHGVILLHKCIAVLRNACCRTRLPSGELICSWYELPLLFVFLLFSDHNIQFQIENFHRTDMPVHDPSVKYFSEAKRIHCQNRLHRSPILDSLAPSGFLLRPPFSFLLSSPFA